MALPQPDDIRMICSDVDGIFASGARISLIRTGTLLTSAHIPHDRTVKAVRALRKLRPDLPFVICTGKQLVSVTELRETLGLDPAAPSICCQGAVAYASSTGEPVAQHAIDPTTVVDVIEGTRSRPYAVFAFVHDAAYLLNDAPHADAAKRRDWLEIASRYDKNIIDARAEPMRSDIIARIKSGELPIVKVTSACDESDVVEAEAMLRTWSGAADAPRYHITRAVSFILELVPYGISKQSAIATLCQTLDIPISSVMALGDGENDAGMLAAVGHGVAMANAVPMTKAAARYETLSNDEGGVGAFLERVYNL